MHVPALQRACPAPGRGRDRRPPRSGSRDDRRSRGEQLARAHPAARTWWDTVRKLLTGRSSGSTSHRTLPSIFEGSLAGTRGCTVVIRARRRCCGTSCRAGAGGGAWLINQDRSERDEQQRMLGGGGVTSGSRRRSRPDRQPAVRLPAPRWAFRVAGSASLPPWTEERRSTHRRTRGAALGVTDESIVGVRRVAPLQRLGRHARECGGG